MKKYVVHLTDAERNELEEHIHQQKGARFQVRRVQILLKADAAPDKPEWEDRQISDAFDCSVNTVQTVRKHYYESGLPSTLAGLPHGRKPRLLDGGQVTQIIALRLSEPPQGYSSRSLRLLDEKAVELLIYEQLSRQTVKKLLKKQI